MSIKFVEKRDGRIEEFNFQKIKNGIFKAVKAAGGINKEKSDLVAEKVFNLLNERFLNTETIKFNDILDTIETILIKNGHDKTARVFILYRYQDNTLRKAEDIEKDNILIKEYLDKSDWTVKENANMSYSLQGLNVNLSSKLTQNYFLSTIYPNEISKLHIDGDIHIHDLGTLGPYCVGWDLQHLLYKGFNGVEGKISSGPPKHFRTALGQVVNFIFTLQGEAAGAQAFSNFDTLLAPFIKNDNLSKEEVIQSVQEFLYNMNVPTRTGFQTPFSNITLDVICPEKLKNRPVVLDGKLMEFTYGECQNEMDIFNEVFCELMLKGDYHGRLFSFPIPTYNIHKNFDWDDSRHNKMWEMTAKYGIPYFANYVNSDMDPDQATSMCCRLRIDKSQLEHRGGGLFGSSPNTGSMGVVTINLPRIGYLAVSEEDFFKQLDYLMDAAKNSLLIKTKEIEKLTEYGLYPYTKVFLDGIKKQSGRYWANHFLTIGLLGMNEACLNFLKKDITTQEGHDFAEKVLEHMRNKIIEYQKDTKYLFNLEATPGEGTTRRFANIDKKRYPEILVANEEKYKNLKVPPYYTNSSQVSVDSKLDLFQVLKNQNSLQPKYTGGTVLHIFLGERLPSVEATKSLVKKIVTNYNIPYISITPTFSICPIHGYLVGEHKYCPKCAEV